MTGNVRRGRNIGACIYPDRPVVIRETQRGHALAVIFFIN